MKMKSRGVNQTTAHCCMLPLLIKRFTVRCTLKRYPSLRYYEYTGIDTRVTSTGDRTAGRSPGSLSILKGSLLCLSPDESFLAFQLTPPSHRWDDRTLKLARDDQNNATTDFGQLRHPVRLSVLLRPEPHQINTLTPKVQNDGRDEN